VRLWASGGDIARLRPGPPGARVPAGGGDPARLRPGPPGARVPAPGGDPARLRARGGDPAHVPASGGDIARLRPGPPGARVPAGGGDPARLRALGGDPARLRTVTGELGQASAEFVALLPLCLLLLAGAWQFVLAGDALWNARVAARAAARAQAVGADPRAAARAHLPARLEHALGVRAGDDGDVRVSLHVPSVLGALDLGRVSATAHFERQAG
jgi:hypothetical protein